jgi:hypothetical protein
MLTARLTFKQQKHCVFTFMPGREARVPFGIDALESPRPERVMSDRLRNARSITVP